MNNPFHHERFILNANNDSDNPIRNQLNNIHFYKLTSHKFIRLRKRIVNAVTNTPIIKIKMNGRIKGQNVISSSYPYLENALP
jgi:hypothetical protein